MEKGEIPPSQRRKERFGAALEAAQEAFWEAFAARYPEIRIGDLDPGAQFAFSEAAERAAKAWLSANEIRPPLGPQR